MVGMAETWYVPKPAKPRHHTRDLFGINYNIYSTTAYYYILNGLNALLIGPDVYNNRNIIITMKVIMYCILSKNISFPGWDAISCLNEKNLLIHAREYAVFHRVRYYFYSTHTIRERLVRYEKKHVPIELNVIIKSHQITYRE